MMNKRGSYLKKLSYAFLLSLTVTAEFEHPVQCSDVFRIVMYMLILQLQESKELVKIFTSKEHYCNAKIFDFLLFSP